MATIAESPLGQDRSARPDAPAAPSVQMVSNRELHAILMLLPFMGASLALRLLVSAGRFSANIRDTNLKRARTRRTPKASRAPGIEPRTTAPDLTQRTPIVYWFPSTAVALDTRDTPCP